MRKKIILTCLGSILLVSCSNYHQIMKGEGSTSGVLSNYSMSNITVLDKNSPVCIALPKNSTTNHASYLKDFVDISNVINISLRPYTTQSTIYSKYRSEIEGLEFAKDKNCRYVIFPNITSWEDRHTFWTGVPDKISLNIDIFDVNNGELIDHFTIKGRSSNTAGINQKPYELIYHPLKNIFKALYNEHD